MRPQTSEGATEVEDLAMSTIGGQQLKDPWEWDTEQLIDALCSSTSHYSQLSSVIRELLPDRDVLASGFHSNEIDGQVFLRTYVEDLCRDLHITKTKHRTGLREAVEILRRVSRKYGIYNLCVPNNGIAWTAGRVQDSSGRPLTSGERRLELEDSSSAQERSIQDAMQALPPCNELVRSSSSTRPPPTILQSLTQAPSSGRRPREIEFNSAVQKSLGTTGTHELTRSSIHSTSNPTSSPWISNALVLKKRPLDPLTLSTTTAAGDTQGLTSPPSQKKQRITPTLIPPGMHSSVLRNVETERDLVTGHLYPARPDEKTHADLALRPVDDTVAPVTEYLDEKAVSRFDCFDMGSSSDEQNSKTEFSHVFKPQPRGRSLQVKWLQKRRWLPELRKRRPHKTDTVPGGDESDDDDIVRVTPNSDDEDFDSETWAEIEADAEEDEQEKNQNTGLSQEEAKSVIDECCNDLISEWKDRRLPKLIAKANHLWKQARREGLRRALGRKQEQLGMYDKRVENLRGGLLVESWSKKAHLEEMARNALDMTIHQLQDCRWVLSILESPVEPEYVPRRRKAGARKPRPKRSADASGDETLMTSESENGFIVDDELGVDDMADVMDIDEDFGLIVDDAEALHNQLTTNGHHEPEPGARQDTETANGSVFKVSRSPSTDGAKLMGAANGPRDDGDNEDQEVDNGRPPRHDGQVKLVLRQSPGNTAYEESSGNNKVEIDLRTPEKRPVPDAQSSVGLGAGSFSSKVRLELTLGSNVMGEHWRLFAAELERIDPPYLKPLFKNAKLDTFWEDIIAGLARDVIGPPFPDKQLKEVFLAHQYIRLFDIFTTGKAEKFRDYKCLSTEQINGYSNATGDSVSKFKSFVLGIEGDYKRYCVELLKAEQRDRRRAEDSERLQIQNHVSHMDLDEIMLVEDGDSSSQQTRPRRKKRPIRRDGAAQNLRDSNIKRMQEQDDRRKMLRKNLADGDSSAVARQKSHLIINESKEENQGLIYVPDEIAGRIKDHQVEGVRFLWNQIITDQESEERQGCLLAHTMGLGKTMQIITLLVAISDAASSNDPSIRTQIPKDLRRSQTLILVPSGLVGNWMDELLLWTPKDHHLGPLHVIESTKSDAQGRVRVVEEWAADGGVLLMGYSIFTRIAEQAGMLDLLTDRPSLVVADEAHKMKDPRTKLSKSTANFRTHVRIALTGSPMANNLAEYHSMIDWIAPNFLSSMAEFRHDYATPIEEGLGQDSTPNDRRRALTKLRALQETVAPKVHRKTIAALKDGLPPKKEFVLFTPLTELQLKLYQLLTRHVVTDGQAGSNTRIFAWLDILGRICNHPICFRDSLIEARRRNGEIDADESGGGTVSLSPELIQKALSMLSKLDLSSVELSSKTRLTQRILDESKRIGDRVLVFSQSLPMLDYLEATFKKEKRVYMRLDGSTAMDKRTAMVKDFNRKGDVFLISTTAGGLGLNITGANRVIILDAKFNPQHEQQAVGRAYRIGQRKAVAVYRFVSSGTFEVKMQERGVFKVHLSDRVVDTKHPIPRSRGLGYLISNPTTPERKDISCHTGKDDILDRIIASDLKSIVCDLVMSDTFEEESVEDSVLSAAEQQEARRLVAENRDRRNRVGAALPAYQVALQMASANSLHFTNSLPPGSSQWAAPFKPPTHVDTHEASLFTGSKTKTDNITATGSSYVRRHADGRVTGPPPVYFPSVGDGSPRGSAGDVATAGVVNTALSPIPGARTAVRDSPSQARAIVQRHPHDQLVSQVTSWFKGELVRAFQAGVDSESAKESRKQAAEKLSSAFDQQAGHRQPAVLHHVQMEIMEAVESPGFIQAIVVGEVEVDDLAAMQPEDIGTLRQSIDARSSDTAMQGVEATAQSQDQIAYHRIGDAAELQRLSTLDSPRPGSLFKIPTDVQQAFQPGGTPTRQEGLQSPPTPATGATKPTPRNPFRE